MPNIPPLITHTPNLDPIYKSVASAGIVKTVVAGTNIAVNSADPANPIVSAPGQTAFLYDSGAIVVPTPIPAGYTATNVGATITVPKTGLYIISGTYGINVDAVNGATFGLTDDIGVSLVPTPPVVGVNPVAIDFHPYSMPNTGAGGADYGSQSSLPVLMTAGVPYQPKYWTDNLGGTMAVPAGGLAMELKLVALC